MTVFLERTLWEVGDRPEVVVEESRYLRDQLITYIGNKRRLLQTLEAPLRKVQKRLGKPTLRILDGFAGSGVVSRFFKQHAELLISNDLECYAQVIGKCYLANVSSIDMGALREHHRFVSEQGRDLPIRDGFIRRLYAPAQDDSIQPGERAFYTSKNAMRIDSFRHLIDKVPSEYRPYLLAPLLSEASIHANTSGVFKGFYKNNKGIGQFGGQNRDALSRITGEITLPFPVFSRYECEVEVCQADANQLVRSLDDLDLAYFDPPYNQHPYGSNYFMLNLILNNEEPAEVSRVSGIAQGWQRSRYNKKPTACEAIADLIENTPASHLLISYNSEGFVSQEQFDAMLKKHGRVELVETLYNAFRGSRNLRGRPTHVKEHLYLLERG